MSAISDAIINLILDQNRSSFVVPGSALTKHQARSTRNCLHKELFDLHGPPPPQHRRTGPHDKRDGSPTGETTSSPGPSRPPLESSSRFPDIIVDSDGCIILCTECDSSTIGRSSDGFHCYRCGHEWFLYKETNNE